MWRTALRNVAGHKLRLAATALAVTLGVAFMAGTLVLTDTISKTFDGLFADAYGGTDAVVRATAAFESPDGFDERGRVDVGLVDLVAGVDGVAAAAGNVFGYAQVVDRSGEAMGDPERILHVGGHGAGYAVKLMINQLWFSHLIATAEVLSVGVAAGVDLGVLRDALIASPANSTFVSRDVLSILEHGDYDEGFAIALACKDLGLSIDLARSVGMPVELSSLVEQIFRRSRARYGDRAGEMTPVRLYEELLGRDLRLGVPA